MHNIHLGCGLYVNLLDDAKLTYEIPGNKHSGLLLLSMLSVSVKCLDGINDYSLQDFINLAEDIHSGIEIYLRHAQNHRTKLVSVAQIECTSAEQLSVELIQEIGMPILRSAIYNILPQQKEVLPLSTLAETKPKTDLHTHFTGAITADMLLKAFQKRVELNSEKGDNQQVHYKIEYLEKVGIDTGEMPQAIDKLGKAKHGYVDITGLLKNEYLLAKFKLLLEIPVDKRIIFEQMEDYYGYRGVFIQDVELFPFFLQELANDYQSQGINYVEISFAKVAKPSYLKVIHETLPIIEQNTGVKLRFLAMLCRTATAEMRALQVQKYERISLSSPYVVGIDLLSAEINSGYTFYPELTYIAKNFPNKVVRVHAGETSYHLENVKAVVKLAKRFPEVCFRVGHGTYGVDDALIQEIKGLRNIIIEINMVSNIALNMHDCNDEHPIDKYLSNQVPVVLGSDGHGLYQSRNTDLTQLLTYRYTLADTCRFMEDIQNTESKHIAFVDGVFVEESLKLFKRFIDTLDREEHLASQFIPIKDSICQALENEDVCLEQVNQIYLAISATQLAQKYFLENIVLSSSVYENYRNIAQQKAELDRQAKQQLSLQAQTLKRQIEDAIGVEPLLTDIGSDVNYFDLPGKTPLMLSGVINYPSHDSLDFYEKIREVIASIKTLLETLDSREVYFVTTGQDIGIQKVLHAIIGQYNQTVAVDKRYSLVAYVPRNVKAFNLSSHLSHVVVIEDIKSIYQMYRYFSKLAYADNLLMISFSENMWLKDVIHVVTETMQSRRSVITAVDGLQVISSVFANFFEELKPDYRRTYAEHLQLIQSVDHSELLAVYGSALHYSPKELTNLLLLTFDEEELTEEQKDCAFVTLMKCFQLLQVNVGCPERQLASLQMQIEMSSILTSGIQQSLLHMVLQLWQEATRMVMPIANHDVTSQNKVVIDSHHRRSSFLNSKTNSMYNAPIGDKVGFKLSRDSASAQNYTELERIAINAVLDEQYRKRSYKKREELKYLTCLLLVGKNTQKKEVGYYLDVCIDLFIYLNNKFVLTQDSITILSMLEQDILSSKVKDVSHVQELLQNMLTSSQISFDHDNYLDEATVNLLLDNLAVTCIGEYTFERLKEFFNNLDLSSHTSERKQHFSTLIENYTSRYFRNASSFGEKNTYIVNRITRMGLCFDNIKDTLSEHGFVYKALYSGAENTLGFYYQGVKILDVYWGNARYYPVKTVNSVQVFKKHRLREDKPWVASEFLDEEMFEYILDKRGNFIRRFTYRCIRPTERMLLANSIAAVINPKSATATFEEFEGNRQNKKFFLTHQGSSHILQEVITNEIAELSLNRMGTYRFVTSGQSAHKYDLRANNETLFIRQANVFDQVPNSTHNMWQGGGVVKIDLTKIEQLSIRSQYKAFSRANMDKVKEVIGGVYNQKHFAELQGVSDELLAQELDSQINKARKSALRNREIHLSRVPIDAIVGWKPFLQFPVWFAREQINMPIILSKGEYFTKYPACETEEPSSDDFVHSIDVTTNGTKTLDTFMQNMRSRFAVMLNELRSNLTKSKLIDAHAISCILKAVSLNLHFAYKYIYEQDLRDILDLSNKLFKVIQAEAPKLNTFERIDILAEQLSPLITQCFASWCQKKNISKPYACKVSMAFYLSPEKTVQRQEQLNATSCSQINI